MKNLSILFIAFCISQSALSKDRVILKSGVILKGEIAEITLFALTIKTKPEDHIQLAPGEVDFIMVKNQKRKVFLQDEMYIQGQSDAEIYHKRFGGNFAAGLLGGVIGFIIVAVTDAKAPDAGLVGQEKAGDHLYREGYNKTGKNKNIKAAGIGWGVGFVITIIIIAAAGASAS